MTQAAPTHTTNSVITVTDLMLEAGEPRVRDLRLAEALGFVDPHMIRTLIKRHISALERFGSVSVEQRKPGKQGGRPGTEYHLNKKQALYITAKSDTPIAADVTVSMVEVFDAYLAGQMKTVAVKAHRRTLPAPRDDTGDLLKIVFSNLFDVVRSAETAGPGHGSFQEALIDAVSNFLGRRDEPKKARRPTRFSDTSDPLKDLRDVFLSARTRVQKGLATDFETALGGVIEDMIQQRDIDPTFAPSRPLFDWDHDRYRERAEAKPRGQLKVIDCRQSGALVRSG